MHLPSPHRGVDPLEGTWSATRWQYHSTRDHALSVDVVCDKGGSVTLSFGAGSYVLTCEQSTPALRTTEGGEFKVLGETLELRPHQSVLPKSVRWLLTGDTLTLRSEQTSHDFGASRPDEPSYLVAVLVRV